MRINRRSAGLVTAILVAGGATSAAYAQAPGFRCPKPGTVVVSADQTSTTTRGADPNDAEVCLSTNTSYGEQRSLLGFWSLPLREPSEEGQVRAAMRALLSGQKAEVSFDITVQIAGSGRGGTSANFQKIPTTFKKSANETVEIGGRSINTIVFERVERVPNGALTRKHYYDPVSAVWVRTGDAMRDGVVVVSGGKRASITVP